MSSMDLDRPLDDLIKQKKNKIKKKYQEQQKNQAVKKQQKKDNKANLNLQTRAKIKKPIGPKSGKSNIISRLVLFYLKKKVFFKNSFSLVDNTEI